MQYSMRARHWGLQWRTTAAQLRKLQPQQLQLTPRKLLLGGEHPLCTWQAVDEGC